MTRFGKKYYLNRLKGQRKIERISLQTNKFSESTIETIETGLKYG